MGAPVAELGSALSTVFQHLYRAFSPGVWVWLVSYSGGKDSTLLLFASLRFAEERGFALSVVYNDSGGDLPELRGLAYRVLDHVERLGHAVYVTRPERTFFDYLLTRYSPPRWNFRWCCKRLKELPFRRLVSELARRGPVLNLLGLRREEARWRSWLVRRAGRGLVYAAPLRDLKAGDVWSLLEEYAPRWVVRSLREVYGGAERSGCWFCPLVLRDRLLESRPQLLRLKLEILESWCSGRREHILELSERYPELVRVSIGPGELLRDYPCGKRCRTCTVMKVRSVLKTSTTEPGAPSPKPLVNAVEP